MITPQRDECCCSSLFGNKIDNEGGKYMFISFTTDYPHIEFDLMHGIFMQTDRSLTFAFLFFFLCLPVFEELEWNFFEGGMILRIFLFLL